MNPAANGARLCLRIAHRIFAGQVTTDFASLFGPNAEAFYFANVFADG